MTRLFVQEIIVLKENNVGEIWFQRELMKKEECNQVCNV